MPTMKWIKAILYTAAFFNIYSAVTLFFYPVFMPINGMAPLPNHPLFITMLASLIAAFGVGYYWVARDCERNWPILKLGVVGKVLVFLAVGYVFATQGDSMSRIMFGFTLIDLAYAAFFAYVLFRVVPEVTAA